MRFTTLAILAASMLSVTATDDSSQTIQAFPCLTESQVDAQVPACAKQCQQAALALDGCSNYEDVACHCAATGKFSDFLTTCLANSTCACEDLYDLDNIIIPVCTYFNATTNGLIAKPVCGVSSSLLPSSSSTLSKLTLSLSTSSSAPLPTTTTPSSTVVLIVSSSPTMSYSSGSVSETTGATQTSSPLTVSTGAAVPDAKIWSGGFLVVGLVALLGW